MNFFEKFNQLDLNKKEDKKFLISFCVSLLGIILLLVGTSAAYLTFRKQGTINTLTSGVLSLTLPEEGNSITLLNALPSTDTIGLKQASIYHFSMKSESTIASYYEVRLVNSCSTSQNVTINGTSITPNVCIPNQYIKVAVSKNDGNYVIKEIDENGLIESGYMGNKVQESSFNIKIWLAEDTPNSYQSKIDNSAERNVIYVGKMQLYSRQLLDGEIVATNLDATLANEPILATGMIPVYYDEADEVWRKADVTNINENYKWYDYNAKMWANAVTVTDANRTIYTGAANGTEIPMSDINTMLVWIPRFSAVTPTTPGVGNEEEIDITFLPGTTGTAHDAFTFGTQNLKGFWVGKFELTGTIGTACTSEACTTAALTVLPGITSLGSKTVSNFFFSIRSMENSGNAYGFNNTIDTTLDTHMMKNNEWGAVTYLTQSKYGRCINGECSEVERNNNDSLTGYGAINKATTGFSSTSIPTNEYGGTTYNRAYNTAIGQTASTTVNIYGIYDMSGGKFEYVMGNYNNTTGDSGFASTWFSSNTKYINTYTTSAAYTTSGLQHAMVETYYWYGDYANFVNSTNQWIIRGGNYYNGIDAGVMYYNRYTGIVDGGCGTRLIITK